MFPGQQGGPLEHVIAAKAVAFKLAAEPEFAERQQRTLAGAKHPRRPAAGRRIPRRGIYVVTGGTDVHLVLVDLRDSVLDGKQAEDRLHPVGITVNRNAVRSTRGRRWSAPGYASAPPRWRLEASVTTSSARSPTSSPGVAAWFDDDVAGGLRARVAALAARFPLYPDLGGHAVNTTAARRRPARTPRLPLAQPGTEAVLRRRHRRRRRPRPGHRLLPGQEPRHHQRRRAREGLAGRRQHGPQHHDHPVQLPVGRERRASTSTRSSCGKAWRRTSATPILFSQRGVLNLAHSLQDVRDSVRRVEANRLNGIDAEWVDPAEVKELCPIVNISPDIRYPVLGATYQPRAGIAKHDYVAWGFARAADALGVDLIQDCEVTGFVATATA